MASLLREYLVLGDEVLEIGPCGLGVADYDGDVQQYTWHKQELVKGRSALPAQGWLGFTSWAGWGFAPGYEDPTNANLASDAQLVTNAVFRHNPAEMFTNTITKAKQDEILTYGIPALSAPMGRQAVTALNIDEIRNFDLNVLARPNGWGRDGGFYGVRWLHGDHRTMAYFFNYPLFDLFVTEGELR